MQKAVLAAAAALAVLAGCAGKTQMKKTAAAPTPTPAAAAAPKADAKRAYTVRKGDSLWAIAGRKGVYGDPFLWPLLYRANRDQIVDPDVIEVNQDLRFAAKAGQAERAEARRKAEDTPRYSKDGRPRKVLPIQY